MSPSVTSPETVLKYEVEVGDQGRVELNVPFAPVLASWSTSAAKRRRLRGSHGRR